jgi:hypothetical protein
MKRLLALLLLVATTPAFAGEGEVTILRGSSAPPQPWYEPPPPPPPQPPVVYLPSYSMSYWLPLIVSPGPLHHRLAPTTAPAVPDGWPLLGRNR